MNPYNESFNRAVIDTKNAKRGIRFLASTTWTTMGKPQGSNDHLPQHIIDLVIQ